MVFDFLKKSYPLEKHLFLLPRFSLGIIGFYPETKSSILLNLWTIFNFLVLSIGNYAEFYYGMHYIRSDIFTAIDAMCPVASSIVSWFKMCCIWWYRKEIKQLIERVRILNEAQRSAEKDKMKCCYFAMATRVTTLMMWFAAGTSTSFSIRALLTNYWRSTMGELVIYEIPFKMMFPDYILKLPYAPLAFLFSHWHGYVTVASFVGVDGFFMGFCFYFSTLLKSLALDVKATLSELPDETILSAKQEHGTHTKLSDLINRHNEVFDLVQRFSNVMVALTLAHFVSSGLIIGTGCICVLLMPGAGVMTYVGYSLAVLAQIFVYCLGGTVMADASEELVVAAYQSHWYSYNIKMRKMLLLLMIRAQRDLVVKVPFFAPSFPTLTSVLRFVGSVVTLAKSIL